MECPKCGTILEDDSKFCVACGAHLDGAGVAAPADQNPVATQSYEVQQSPLASDTNVPEQSERHTVNPIEGIVTTLVNANLIGLIVGTLIIVVGIIRIMSAGTSVSSTSFGGDFYTYTYQGIVAISEILASIEVSLGWVIVAIGAAIDVHSLQH